MTKRLTSGKKASSEGQPLRVAKQTLKDLTPAARASKAAKGGKGPLNWGGFSRGCGTGSGG